MFFCQSIFTNHNNMYIVPACRTGYKLFYYFHAFRKSFYSPQNTYNNCFSVRRFYRAHIGNLVRMNAYRLGKIRIGF